MQMINMDIDITRLRAALLLLGMESQCRAATDTLALQIAARAERLERVLEFVSQAAKDNAMSPVVTYDDRVQNCYEETWTFQNGVGPSFLDAVEDAIRKSSSPS